MYNCIIVTGYIMEANELRIGNCLNFPCDSNIEEFSWFVSDIKYLNYDYDTKQCFVNDTPLDETKPISLTEEWLVRFGFLKKETNNEYGWYKNCLNRQLCWCHSNFISIEFNIGQCDEFTNTLLDIECKHVHQLQNLYFALTGEELTIK